MNILEALKESSSELSKIKTTIFLLYQIQNKSKANCEEQNIATWLLEIIVSVKKHLYLHTNAYAYIPNAH